MTQSRTRVTEPPLPSSRCRTILVGVGGGGCNAASHLAGAWTNGPDVFTVNSDAQALAANFGTRSAPIGARLTQGLGAGGDPGVGQQAATEERDALRDLMIGADLVVLLTGLGGGTGTGATPVISQLARDEGALTLCFATLPFEFEGPKRMEIARQGLRDLAAHCDIVVCLPNQNLLEQVKDQESMVQTFARSDQMLAAGVQALSSVLAHAGVINVDFADLRQLVDRSNGLCAFGYGEGRGARKADQAIAQLAKHPALDQGRLLAQASACLINITGGAGLPLIEVQQIMNKVRGLLRPDAHVVMGVNLEEGFGEKLALTLLVAQPRSAAVAFGLKPGAGGTQAGDTAGGTEAGRAQGGSRLQPLGTQGSLNLEPTDKGRFRDMEPTLFEGEDLDYPAFRRRGVKLSFEK